MSELQVTPQTHIKRGAKKADYSQETIYQILDEAFICHIGGVVNGYPQVQPNLHWRIGDTLFIHGSSKNGLISAILASKQTCVAVSLFDGIVLARSAFHHSINFRSVMIFGTPTLIEDEVQKKQLLDALLEKCAKGRSHIARAPNKAELKATSVIAIPIESASAKVRTGPPVDDPEDMALDIWAGIIPVHLHFGEPIAEPS